MSEKSNHWSELASSLGAEVAAEPAAPIPATAPVASEPPPRPAPREPRPKPCPAAKSDWSKLAANLGLTPELAVEPSGDAGAFLEEVSDLDADESEPFASPAAVEDEPDLGPAEEDRQRDQGEPIARHESRDKSPRNRDRDRDRDRGRGRGRRRGRRDRDDSRADGPRRERVEAPGVGEEPYSQRPRSDDELESSGAEADDRDADLDESRGGGDELASRRPRDDEEREGRSRRGRRRRRRRGGERPSGSPSRSAQDSDRVESSADDDELDAADPLADFADEHEPRRARSPREHEPLGETRHFDEEDDEEDASSGLSHKNIPNWEEAIGIVVETNLAARSRSPQEGAGRGQGRSSRGGGRSGRGGRGGRGR